MVNIDAIIRTKRKTISILISPQGKVIVRAPVNCPASYINNIIIKREAWIIKNQNRMQQRATLNQDIISYKKILFGGIVYRLALADNIKKIVLYDDALFIPYKMPKDKVKPNIIKWYKQYALKLTQDRVSLYANIMDLHPQNVSINNTKASWGLCNNRKEIKLNWRIAMLPLKLVDYIVVHELAHLCEFNHSKRFWQIVLSVLPDTKERRSELKKGDYLLQLFR